MRKLSKKISMLMVLAMLVSLFSGVVSASAASKWSFYDKTADETIFAYAKETYKMENDQFADFDLYKEGKIVDTDVYTVVYESSDEEVVWVNAKNGKLRAQKDAEIGATAEITAHITNKVNGAKADRSFTIEIVEAEVEEPVVEVEYAIVSNIGEETYLTGEKYELEAVVTADGEEIEAEVAFSIDGVAITEFAPTKAGTYTIVATTTIDGEEYVAEFEVVVEESVPEIVEAKQTTLSSVAITFNKADWAKDFASKVKLSYFAGEVEIADLVKSAVAKDETVTVTLYNNLVADTTYKFAYDGYDECFATVKGAKAEPAYMTMDGGNVPQTGKQATVKFFTADDIEITSDTLKAGVTYKSLDENICDVTSSTGDIFFYEVGKTVVVEATYDMGWNEDGTEKTDLIVKAAFTSVNEFTYSNPVAYAVGDNGADATKLTYGSTVTINLDENKELFAKYVATKYDTTKSDKYIKNAKSEEDADFTFYSTNDSIVIVSADGVLSPCSEGTTSVYMKDANGKVVGSVVVIVKAAGKLNSFAANIADKYLSTAIENEKAVVAVTTKDQHGKDYSKATYTIELVSPTSYKDADNNTIALTIADFFKDTDALAVADGKINLVLNADGAAAAIADGKTQVVAFNLKAVDGNIVKSQRLNVTIKDMTGVSASKSTLNVSAANVDTKLDKANADAYNVTIKLFDVDNAGFEMGNHAIQFVKAAVATAGDYSVVISKGNDVYDVSNAHFAFDATKNEITIKPVVVSGNNIIKIAGGNYKVQLFKGLGNGKAQPIDAKYVNITDSTAAITVEAKADTVDSNDAAGVEGALKFLRNGVEISNTDEKNYIEVIEVTNPVDANNKYYVRTIKVKVSPKEMKSDSGFGSATFVETVTVNQLFKY